MESQIPIPADPPPVPGGGLPFPVVGIGASAGGYAALMSLLQNMPPNPGMALVVILHLAADEPSAADKVLQRATGMPVVQVAHTMPILPDHVYVIPPDRSLAMHDGHLVLDQLERSRGRPVAIDMFLRTLATAHKERAIGVVLSGMGSDGTAGLACIKEMGGATIAQLPSDAEYGSMPHSVIESGMADFVLAAGAIPAKLAELRDIAAAIRRRALQGRMLDGIPLDLGPWPEAVLREVLEVLRERTGHDFTHYRRPTLLRRLERRLQVRGLADLAGYCELLRRDSSESRALLKDLLIGVTSFYRDPEAFEALDRLVLPALFAPGRPAPRAWVAACSSGEEAYTVAMLLAGQAGRSGEGQAWQVFGSDLDDHAVEVARAGVYPASIAESVPAPQLERHFTLEAGQYKVRKALRDQVLFTRHNLLHEPAFSRLDLISCCNFLIYLNLEMHRRLLKQFHFALNPGGYLMLGSAESIDAAADLFEPVDAAQNIYRARPVARMARAPALSFARAALPAQRSPEAADGGAPAPPSAQRRGRLFSFAEIHLHKAAELAPPSILLNADADIVHVSERAARFLRPAGGEPTRELVALVLPPLQLALRAALFQARRSGRQASSGPVCYQGEDGVHAVDMRVLPFQDPHAEGELLLVEFHAPPPGAASSDAEDAADAENAPDGAAVRAPLEDGALLRQLDDELRHARRQLQEMIEQTETSSSEMRLHAEETQTTIEELCVRAEELDRGRADLLSRNQELAADNAELHRRAAESLKAHDDLANLIASSGVATIFLDRDMRIQRYTPRIADFFNVLPSDVGRPLLHITNRLDYPRLAEEAAKVFDTLQALEREVRSKDGRDYIVRVHPYRTTTDRIEGAVMSFFDITGRRAAEEALRASEARLSSVFESLPIGACVMDADGVVLMTNRAMQRYLPTSTMPSRDRERGGRWRAWHADGRLLDAADFPGIRALRGERLLPGIEMLYREEDGRDIWTQVASAPVSDDTGRYTGEATVVITDIDALKRTEATLRQNEDRLRSLIGSLALALWEANADGMIVVDSPSWRAYTGQTPEAWLGEGWLDAVHPEDRAQAGHQWREAVARRGVVDAVFRLSRPEGGWRCTRVRAEPLFNLDGSVRKWVGMNVEAGTGVAGGTSAPAVAKSFQPDRSRRCDDAP
jgi:two-component system CheB/CheR fusion protein